MNPFLPPSREDVRRNLHLLVEDWKSGSPLRRYFIASQLASGVLVGACSIGSIVAGMARLPVANFGLLAVAGLCLLHTVATWNLLKRQFQVRYEIW